MGFLRDALEPQFEAQEAIARNLEATLNSRPGYGSVVEVYGLGEPEFFDRSKGQARALEKELLVQVRRFEPRLQEPLLTCLGRTSSLWIDFELSGLVQGAKERFTLRFHAIFRNVVVAHVHAASEAK